MRTLAQLPDRQRAAVVLHYYEGYPPREIASIFGSTPSTVRVHLLQARRKLHALLEGTDDD